MIAQVSVAVAVQNGETLTSKIGQIIADPNVRMRREGGVVHVMRHMTARPEQGRPGQYVVTFSYEPYEEQERERNLLVR